MNESKKINVKEFYELLNPMLDKFTYLAEVTKAESINENEIKITTLLKSSLKENVAVKILCEEESICDVNTLKVVAQYSKKISVEGVKVTDKTYSVNLVDSVLQLDFDGPNPFIDASFHGLFLDDYLKAVKQDEVFDMFKLFK